MCNVYTYIVFYFYIYLKPCIHNDISSYSPTPQDSPQLSPTNKKLFVALFFDIRNLIFDIHSIFICSILDTYQVVSELLTHTLDFAEFSISLVRWHIFILKCTNDMLTHTFNYWKCTNKHYFQS